MRILIIKQGALGDVVMATALVDAIQRAHPGADFALLTAPAFAGLFAGWPALRVHAYPRRGLRAMWAMLRFIRAQHFDRVYDLQGSDRTGLLCALSGIRERVGNHARFPYTHHPRERWRGQCHIFERMNEVLAAAGVAPAAPRPRLLCSAAERAGVAAFIAQHGLVEGRYVVLHAGASPTRQDKCWPGFGDFAVRLERAGLRAVWLGAGADAPRNRALAARAGLDASDRFSIPQLAELARRARFALTNDSGPMHAIAAAGVPVFGLFGPSDWRRNHALGQREHVLACTELVAAYAGQRSADCLAALTVDTVWQRIAARGLLEPGDPSS
ncbi:MAG TPA: glycosyltransferase family 9 protein [Gammaproteobacteria bacterium]|nr:glycosyltransferase family 9 protein [Gammaproteobacteria bacterium]